MTETPEEFLSRMRSVGYISRRSGDRVTEYKDSGGNLVKEITDELNNTVTMRSEGQDVTIRPKPISPRSSIYTPE